MRVLLVTGSFPPMKCGVGDYSYRLAKALALDPATPIGVLTSVHDEKAADFAGLEVFPIIKSWRFAEAIEIIRLIRRWLPDIVHIQYPTQGYGEGFLPWIVPLIGFLMRRKVVQTWHESYGTGKRTAPKFFLKAMIPGGLVVVRPQYKESLPMSLRWALWNKQFAYIRNASPFPAIDLDENARSALRKRYLKGQKRLVVFFGFMYPHKGTELLFEIGDPATDQIVIAGNMDENSEYHRKIMTLASAARWAGKVTVTGFLLPADIAALLAVADAVILPYRVGGGEWNTSLHAAVSQGSFVITTSLTQNGYDEARNTFFAKVDDVPEMKSALATYAGIIRKREPGMDKDEWNDIAGKHRTLYESLLTE